MPELPEVETTASILNRELKGLKILDVWTDYDSKFYANKNEIKNKKYFPIFRKQIVGKKILGAGRRAKNVLIHLSDNKTILVHMKMTGHLMYGKYLFQKGEWLPPKLGPLRDPYNRYIHLAFTLSDGNTLVLSDARKFAKVLVFDTDAIHVFPDLKKLGPEPLEKEFTFSIFKERILKKPKGKIKTVLMDQELIAGIGNIYSDEALWMTGIHPLSQVEKIKEKDLKNLYQNILKVLKGCAGIVKRIKVGGRSAHFCDCHQK